MIKLKLLALIFISALLIQSCADESAEDQMVEEETEMSFEEKAALEAEEARKESAERYITMTPQQYEVFFRNTREGIVEAISSSKNRLKQYETTLADFKAKKNDVTEQQNLVATNKLKGEKERNKRLEERLKMFDAKIKTFDQVEPNDRPEFIEEMKVILKH